MSKQVQWRRGTLEQNDNFTGAIGEVTVELGDSISVLLVYDGTTFVALENDKGTTQPSNPIKGDFYSVNETNLKVYNGTKWVSLNSPFETKPTNPSEGDYYPDNDYGRSPSTLRVHDAKTTGGWRLANTTYVSEAIQDFRKEIFGESTGIPFLKINGTNEMVGTIKSNIPDQSQNQNTIAMNISYPRGSNREIRFSSRENEKIAGITSNSDTNYNSITIGAYRNSQNTTTGLPAANITISVNRSAQNPVPTFTLSHDVPTDSPTNFNYIATTKWIKNYIIDDFIPNYVSNHVTKYTLPVATSTSLGGVQVPTNSGLVMQSENINLNIATTNMGNNGKTLMHWDNTNKVLKNSTQNIGSASDGKPVYISGGEFKEMTPDNIVSKATTVIATSSKLGMVKIGNNINVTSDGTISVSSATAGGVLGTSSIGNTYTPVYYNGSELKPITVSVGVDNPDLVQVNDGKLEKSNKSLCNDGKSLMYLNNGTLTKSSVTVGSADKGVYLKNGVITACTGSDVPVGTIVMFPVSNTNPGGNWLYCNGSTYNKDTYPALYALIGTSYDTATTNKKPRLPNFVNKVPWGAASANDTSSLYREAGLPNLEGYFDVNRGGRWDGCNVDGKLFTKSASNTGPNKHSHSSTKFTFNAQGYNDIYGNSNTVQPPAVLVRFFIKAA